MTVEVSNDGQHFSVPSLDAIHVGALAVLGLMPSSGSAAGGLPVSVYGTGFQGSSRPTCAFGNTSAMATVLSSELLLCIAPGTPTGAEGSVFVEVYS